MATLLVGAGLALAGAGGVAGRAEEGDEPSPPAAPTERGGRAEGPPRLVGEAAPELFYVEDDAGRLVPVPGFRYRDFMDLFRMKEGLGGPLRPPAAVLENVVVRIDAGGIAADAGGRGATTVPATAELTVRQSAGGWAAVAIDLGGLLLTAPPRHDGPGRMLLDATADGGYRAWFDATPEPGGDVAHTIMLEGRLPCESAAASESFAVRVPVSIASRLEIRSARRDPAVRVQPAAPEQTVSAAADEEPGSLVSIAGLAGAARIRISDDRDDGDQRGAAAEAVTESTVRVDGRNAVIDATIRLAQLPPGAARLRIALPPQTTLRGVRPPASVAGRGGAAGRPTVDVAVEVDAEGRAQVELSCERPVDPSGAVAFEAIGFAVDGIAVWRQWGRVSLVVEGDWRIWWRDATTLRRVDPPANVRQQGFVAAFAYDAQPASLPLEVRPRRSRVVIEPEYRYDVGGSRIALDARFRVAVRGAPVSSISFAIDPAWSIDEVGPAGAVDSATISTDAGEIVVPFAQALAGDTVVEVRASRPIQKEDARVGWKLPVPRADLVGPAVVVIASQSDIELLPDNEGITGLVRQTAAAVALADADTSALVYRLDAADGAFAATRRFLPRRVEAAVTAEATLDAAEVAVEQTIRLSVMHVPLEFIEIVVPDAIAAAGSLEVRQEETLLDPTEIAAPGGDDAGDDSAGTTRLRAILSAPLLGVGDVKVRYRMPTPAIPPESTVAFDLPLVLPVGAGVGRQTVTVEAPTTLSLGVRGDAWRRDVGPAIGTGPQAWSAVKPQRGLPLTLSTRRSDAARTMVVEAAWLRTRLLPGVREDLVTYVVSAAGDGITLTVPMAAAEAPATCDVRLDGESVPGALRAGGRIALDLPRADPARRWRIDVRTTVPRDRGWAAMAARFGLPAAVRLEPPTFEPPVLEKRFYWTIHARPDEHLGGLPAGWTSQQRWQPSFAGWRLVPAVTDDELAAWIVAVAGTPAGAPIAAVAAPPTGGTPRLVESTFVYAGVGGPAAATGWLVPTWFAVLLASGATLAAGLAVVYQPAFRQGWVFIAAAATLGLAAAAAPETAPLVAQAAAPGAALAVLAWGLRFLAERRATRRRGGGLSASSLTQHRGSSPSLIVAPAVAESPATTRLRWP